MKKANYGKRILSFVTVIAMILSFTAMIPAASAADLERAYLFDVDFEDGTMANKASSGYTFAHYYNDLHTVTSYETVSERNSKALKIDIAGNQTGVAKFGQDIIDPALNLVDNTTWYEMSFKFDKSIPNVRLYAKNHAAYDVGIFRIATDGKVYINGSSHNIEVNGLTLETGNWYDLKIAVDNHNRYTVCPRVYVWVNGEQYTAGTSEADGAHIWGEWSGDVDMISEMNRMMLYVDSAQTEGTMWMDSFKVYNTPCSMKAGLNIGKYYDIDFENSSWENAVGTSTIAPNTDGHFKPAVVIEDDVIKGSKVAKITGSGTAGQFGCIRDNSVIHSSIKENKVSWYEMSFKFDSKISAIRLEAGENPFMIQESGKLRIGGLEAGVYVGAEIADVTLKPGEWYNLKVAVDCIDKWAGTDTKYYAWLNGELLTTGETPITGCTVSKGYSASSGAFGYWLFIPSDG
ncbi:MAG: hypothetical protein E7508_10175, partial [Ruminococcus sp.]|nr:hypothetical protein [Ruminococcus sp.]